MLDPLEIFSVQVSIRFFLERKTQTISIESCAFLHLSGDGAVTGNKYDFHACIIAETKMACQIPYLPYLLDEKVLSEQAKLSTMFITRDLRTVPESASRGKEPCRA